MDWPPIVLAGAVGGISAAIAGLLIKKDKQNRSRMALVTAAMFIPLYVFSNAYVLPRIESWRVELSLRSVPAFREIAASDPATYEKIRVVFRDAVGKPNAEAYARTHVAALISASLPEHVGRASDESLIAFARASTRVIQALNATNPDACYQFLFPDRANNSHPVTIADNEAQTQMLDSMAAIYRSSANTPEQMVDLGKGEQLLQSLATGLAKDYGSDVRFLLESPGDRAGRKRMCDISAELYRRVADLPPSDAGTVLRYMLAKNSSSKPT